MERERGTNVTRVRQVNREDQDQCEARIVRQAIREEHNHDEACKKGQVSEACKQGEHDQADAGVVR